VVANAVPLRPAACELSLTLSHTYTHGRTDGHTFLPTHTPARPLLLTVRRTRHLLARNKKNPPLPSPMAPPDPLPGSQQTRRKLTPPPKQSSEERKKTTVSPEQRHGTRPQTHTQTTKPQLHFKNTRRNQKWLARPARQPRQKTHETPAPLETIKKQRHRARESDTLESPQNGQDNCET
jgi:hypothetical protein